MSVTSTARRGTPSDTRVQVTLGVTATSHVKRTHRGAVKASVLRKDALAYLRSV